MVQEVLGACFGIDQGSVSNIIARIEPWLEAALPTPEALSQSIADRIEAMPAEKVESLNPSASLLSVMEPSKQNSAPRMPTNSAGTIQEKKLHTHKVQVFGTPTGLIFDLSASMGGSVHDFKQWKGFRQNEGLHRIVGLMGNRVIGYFPAAHIKALPNGIHAGGFACSRKHCGTSP